MADILRTTFQMHSLNENACAFIQIGLKFVLNGLFDDMSALFQVMAWHRTGDKDVEKLF